MLKGKGNGGRRDILKEKETEEEEIL